MAILVGLLLFVCISSPTPAADGEVLTLTDSIPARKNSNDLLIFLPVGLGLGYLIADGDHYLPLKDPGAVERILSR